MNRVTQKLDSAFHADLQEIHGSVQQDSSRMARISQACELMSQKKTEPNDDPSRPEPEPADDEAPETPPTEPQPVPIQDPEQPNEKVPYVVREEPV